MYEFQRNILEEYLGGRKLVSVLFIQLELQLGFKVDFNFFVVKYVRFVNFFVYVYSFIFLYKLYNKIKIFSKQ